MFDPEVFRAKCPWIDEMENGTELMIAWATEGRAHLSQTHEQFDFESSTQDVLAAVHGTVPQLERRFEDLVKPIQDALTTKVAVTRGKTGEILYDNWVSASLQSSWQTECTKGIPHSGDYIHTHYDSKKRVIVDVKNYTRCVPRAEIDKVWDDMATQDVSLGMLVSMNSRVSGCRDGLDIEFRCVRGKKRCVMIVSNALDRKELIAVSLEILRRHEDASTTQQDVAALHEVLETIQGLESLASGLERDLSTTLAAYRKSIRVHYDTMKRIVSHVLPDS